MAGGDAGLAVADRLCVACVELLDVDGAAISLMHGGTTHGTFGSSGSLSRQIDEYQFTLGEGPCVDAFTHGRPVLVADLCHPEEQRWPAFAAAVVDVGIRAVFALPAVCANSRLGVLDLYRRAPGPLSPHDLAGGMLAAELVAVPLLDLAGRVSSTESAGEHDGWTQLEDLERVEVYQATGMIMGALDVGPTEALLRLRAHAFGSGRTASDVARAIVDRRIPLDGGHWRNLDDGPTQ
jgi:hypothetical protein